MFVLFVDFLFVFSTTKFKIKDIKLQKIIQFDENFIPVSDDNELSNVDIEIQNYYTNQNMGSTTNITITSETNFNEYFDI